MPYDIEASIYATKLNELKPGAKVALYYVNSEFGTAYVDEFKKQADELGLQIVDEQTVEPDVTDPPSRRSAASPASCPMRSSRSRSVCSARRSSPSWPMPRRQSAGWAPLVFLTNTCASKLFFGLAGPAAEGVYTSNNLVDPNDPKNAAHPGVKAFLEAYSAAGLAGDPGVTEAGWNVGETTVAILNAALKTGTLSRKSIIEAARNLTFTPSLASADGMQYKMNGEADAYAFQTLQVLQWSVASQTFTEIGDPIPISKADYQRQISNARSACQISRPPTCRQGTSGSAPARACPGHRRLDQLAEALVAQQSREARLVDLHARQPRTGRSSDRSSLAAR